MSTVWLERFVLGGVCVAVFVSLAVINVWKFDWTQRITLGGAILLFSYFVGHTVERQRYSASPPSSLTTPAPPSTGQHKSDAPEQPPPVAGGRSKQHSAALRAKARRTSPLQPLASFSDGQRVLLKQKLGAFAGSGVRLILVGGDPQTGIVFEQLEEIFKDAGWSVQTARIGIVSVVGANFPSVSYLTSANVASPTVRSVFSVFAGLGIDLPLTPDAFMGPGSMGAAPDVVIVVR